MTATIVRLEDYRAAKKEARLIMERALPPSLIDFDRLKKFLEEYPLGSFDPTWPENFPHEEHSS